ncbi:hypothetical protein INR49_020271 [Caranx melampygus]|nr:hypothetical protein INR49_020271 [Caranx melampygus]
MPRGGRSEHRGPIAERVPVGSVLGLLLLWNMVGRMAGPNITASMDGGRHYGFYRIGPRPEEEAEKPRQRVRAAETDG